MKKLLTLIIILSVTFPTGCVVQKKSTLNQLKQRKNPIEAMQLPPRKKPSIDSGKMKAGREDAFMDDEEEISVPEGTAVGLPPDIDFSPLDRIPSKPVQRNVVVQDDKIPLMQGPGTRFKQLGTASANQTYRLLRIQRGPSNQEPWYLVEDDKNNKFFISSKQSSIVEDTVEPKERAATKMKPAFTVKKEYIQKRKTHSLRKIQSAFDPTPTIPEELKKAKHISLNFEGTELYDVITTFCELLQIDYVIEGNITGTVTLQTFNKIQVEDLYDVLEQILAVHNITVVQSGHFYRFIPVQEAGKKPLSIHYANDPNIPPNERPIIQIIPLKHISVESMKNIISPLLTKHASFIEIPETNNLMMIELASNVKRIVKVVEALDIDKLASSDIQLYKLNNADAELVVGELHEIFNSMGYSEAIGESLTFLSLGRLNSIMVVNAFESLLPTIEFWVNKLDQPISQGKVSTFVYYVQHGDAEKMAELINGIFEQDSSTASKDNFPKVKKVSFGKEDTKEKTDKSKTTTSDSTSKTAPKIKIKGGIEEAFDGELTVIPDADTNALIIRTSPRNYPAVLEVLKKLDLLPQQVLIEVLIVDLTVDKDTQTGLEWALKRNSGSNRFSGGVAPSDGSTLGSAIGTVTSSFLPGGSFLVQEPGRLIAQLQAFASESKANVLANPILVTSDNKAANISITDEIPIDSTTITQTGTAQPLTQTTVEFRDVGVKLDILPKINSDNFVNLKIEQEISSQGPVVGNTPSFNVRKVKTEVVLKDNQILVMGGLMRTTETESNDGIPFLKDIPYLGHFFKNEQVTENKTELMLFITPHIISNTEDSEYITRQFQKKLGDMNRFRKRS